MQLLPSSLVRGLVSPVSDMCYGTNAYLCSAKASLLLKVMVLADHKKGTTRISSRFGVVVKIQ